MSVRVRIREDCEEGEALKQRFWSSFNNWIIISQEKWPRTEREIDIHLHIYIDTCWPSGVTTAQTESPSAFHSILCVLPLFHWRGIDKRVQWGQGSNCDTCSETFPQSDTSREREPPFTHRKTILMLYIHYPADVTHIFLRRCGEMLRLIVIQLFAGAMEQYITAGLNSPLSIFFYRHAHLHSLSQARGSFR